MSSCIICIVQVVVADWLLLGRSCDCLPTWSGSHYTFSSFLDVHLQLCLSQPGLCFLLASNAHYLPCQDDKAMSMRKRTTSDEELHDMTGEKAACCKSISTKAPLLLSNTLASMQSDRTHSATVCSCSTHALRALKPSQRLVFAGMLRHIKLQMEYMSFPL